MKKIVKRIVCGIVMIAMILSLVPKMGKVKEVEAAGYNASAALAYASGHWNDGVGMCAQFVSNCLSAGGCSAWSANVDNLFDALKRSGMGNVYELCRNGNASIPTGGANAGKVSPGDVLIFQCGGRANGCSYSHSTGYVHTALVGTFSDGLVHIYQHSSARNNETCYMNYCYLGEKNSIAHVYVYHFGSVNNDPVGFFDSVTSESGNTIHVRGWAYDPDEPNKSISVHVYVGGYAGSADCECYPINADKTRDDVNNAYGISGKHGFDETITVKRNGDQPVYIYAINSVSGNNPQIGEKRVSIIKATTPATNNEGVNNYTPTYGNIRVDKTASQILVNGWVYDKDNVDKKLKIIVTIGGRLNDAGIEKHYSVADKYSFEGNTTLWLNGKSVKTGYYHGISLSDEKFVTNRFGTQAIFVYAENTDSTNNHVNKYKMIYSGNITITQHFSYQCVMDSGKITRKATCITKGEKTYTCTICGRTEVEKIELKDHTIVTDAAVPATTTAPGKTEGSHCSVCGKVFVEQQTIPKIVVATNTEPQTSTTNTKQNTSSNTNVNQNSTVRQNTNVQQNVNTKQNNDVSQKANTNKTTNTQSSVVKQPKTVKQTVVTKKQKESVKKTTAVKKNKSTVSKKKAKKIARVTIKRLKNFYFNKVGVYWKSVKNANGYEIQASTSKKFTTVMYQDYYGTKVSFENLKKNKTYYVRVRAYRYDPNSDSITYGKWSKVKKIKVKK